MERLSPGFSSKLGSFEMHARWITSSTPAVALATAFSSRMSAFTSSSALCFGMTSVPNRNRSMTRTR